jgi:hypothetical protein
VSSHPTDADPLADLPVRDAFAQFIDDAGDFVARHAGETETRPKAVLSQMVAKAKPAGRHLHTDFSRTRIGDRTFDNLNRAAGGRDLCNAHNFQMRPGPVTTQKLEIVTFLQWLRSVRFQKFAQTSGMKKHIREMIDDLKHPKANKDFVPPVQKSKESVADLTPPSGDLSNQVLSNNAEEKVKQLDYQAFESERLQTNS